LWHKRGSGQVVKLPQTLRPAITRVKRMFRQATIRNPDRPIGFQPLPSRSYHGPPGRTTGDKLGTKAARASSLRPSGYPHYRWCRSVTHASPGGARQPMVGAMTIPLQVSGSELSRFKDDKFGVLVYGGLLSLIGARRWGSMVRLGLS